MASWPLPRQKHGGASRARVKASRDLEDVARARSSPDGPPQRILRATRRSPPPSPELNPLCVTKPASQHQERQLLEERFWGDQEPLSKIPFKVLKGHQNVVSSCHFCVDDTKVLSGSYDCSVKLWDVKEGTVIKKFEPQPRNPVSECSVTADSRRISAASFDKKVRSWDLETGQQLWSQDHQAFIVSCKLSPNGKYVAVALDMNHGICILNANCGTKLFCLKENYHRFITACCFDPDSQKVATVSLDRTIKIWDLLSKTTVITISRAHNNAISNCCFTASGHFLCTSSWDKTLKIWNVHTGEFRNHGACVTLMKGHVGSVSSCHFTRDTSYLVSGGYDKSVAIWDVGESYQKLSLKGHNDWVMDVAISNDKKWVLSASKDRTLRVWNVEQIDQVPMVIKNRKALGLQVKQCKESGRIFSTYDSDSLSQSVAETRASYGPDYLAVDSVPRECFHSSPQPGGAIETRTQRQPSPAPASSLENDISDSNAHMRMRQKRAAVSPPPARSCAHAHWRRSH
ncbi:WD repeat-containing protein 88 [Suncus etruscus]|uniref:WD repeat-containing protein 88 n=1 Tax=Suncus etruscus TaxID=109475 RepID=UPI00211015B4|nr:WD repeat-containing protein 88 [Suncus etruscus]